MPHSFTTGDALATNLPIFSSMPISIVRRESVSMNAMCFTHISPTERFTSTQINSLSDGFNMSGIHANRVLAKMVAHQAIRDFPDKQFIEKSVGQKQTYFRDTELRIASDRINKGSPFPTGNVTILTFGTHMYLFE